MDYAATSAGSGGAAAAAATAHADVKLNIAGCMYCKYLTEDSVVIGQVRLCRKCVSVKQCSRCYVLCGRNEFTTNTLCKNCVDSDLCLRCMRTKAYRFGGTGASGGYCSPMCRNLEKLEYDPALERAQGESVASMPAVGIVDFALSNAFKGKQPTMREIVNHYASLGLKGNELVSERARVLFPIGKRMEIAVLLERVKLPEIYCAKHKCTLDSKKRVCVECVAELYDRKHTPAGSAGALAYASIASAAAARPPSPTSVETPEPTLIRHPPSECSDSKCMQCFTLTNQKNEYTFTPSRYITKDHKGLIWRMQTKDKTVDGLTIDVGEAYTEYIKVIGQNLDTGKDRVRINFTTVLALGDVRWML